MEKKKYSIYQYLPAKVRRAADGISVNDTVSSDCTTGLVVYNQYMNS